MSDAIVHASKRCSKCNTEFPATPEFFYRKFGGKHGLTSACKSCLREPLEQGRKRWRANNPDKAREQKRNWRASNPEMRRQQDKSWRSRNITKVRQQSRFYYQNNLQKERERGRLRYATHQQRELERNRRWYAANPERAKIHNSRRKAVKHSLPDTFTATDWQRALDYFHGCCAVCGHSPDEKRTLAADHWIPLSSPDCPGTVPTNIVPLCHGVDGCNNRKSDKDAESWLIEKLGDVVAQRVLKHINSYFEYVRSDS